MDATIRPTPLHDIARYQRHADLCKVLVDPKRLMLLDALRDGEASVSALAERIGTSLTNASQHLGVMRHAGLVAPRRVGTTVYYRISEPAILDACDIVDRIVGGQATG
ncbi:MAG TPA: metalloregulator ArsR/SmtB family transcription factor [Candidatus Limnocylindrales bacterium]|jgi:ArsR family transcriptional regulator, virulence genes transcriptional regulator|nr:metalloregulator ArsR/SmtB family transcription factor [Candidatus Limnocylindrales bacterium]